VDADAFFHADVQVADLEGGTMTLLHGDVDVVAFDL